MIGILLFAALLIAEIVRYFKDDEEFDGLMLFGRPIVTFLSVLFCGGSFWTALLWAAGWGFLGAVIGEMLSESRSAQEASAPADEEDDEEEKEEEGDEGKEEGEDILPLPPTPPKHGSHPVYRSDIFEISGTQLIRCKEHHEYIQIPQGVTTIRENAFANHTYLRGVRFPDTLRTIEAGAFSVCTRLAEIDLPESLETIGDNAFLYCKSLKQVRFPESLKTLGSKAFASCPELTSVTFDEDCAAKVALFAFADCAKLRDFTIPRLVQLCNEFSDVLPFFLGYDEKTTVRCYAGSSAYFAARQVGAACSLIDGKAHETAGDFVIENGVLKSYTGKDPYVVIPAGTKEIQEGVFKNCRNIVRVDIPDSVSVIGAAAFSSCEHLRKVRLPNSLQSIPKNAFDRCYRLEQVVFPQKLVTIEAQAFSGTKLGEVRLPEGLRYIHKQAFGDCDTLHTIHIPSSVRSLQDSLSGSPWAVIVAQPDSVAAQYAGQSGIPLRSPGSAFRTLRPVRSEDLPGNHYRVGYEALSPENKLVYSVVVQALMQMECRYSLTGIPLEKVDVHSVEKALEADYPEIFWVNWKKLGLYMLEGSLTKVYSITKEQRDQMQRQINAAVRPFLASVSPQAGDYEKAKLAYEWLASAVEYDSAGLKAQEERQYDSVTADDLRNIYGAFVKKKVVCTGYALAYTHLLHELGIPCVMRTGGRKLGQLHAWACAKLEGDYYHVDVTWGDSHVFGYEYLGLTDDEMVAMHESMDFLTEHIVCNATRCCYYAKEGLYLDRVDTAEILNIIQQYVSQNNCNKLKIKFADMRLLEQADTSLKEKGRLDSLAKKLGFFVAATTKEDNNILTILMY